MFASLTSTLFNKARAAEYRVERRVYLSNLIIYTYIVPKVSQRGQTQTNGDNPLNQIEFLESSRKIGILQRVVKYVEESLSMLKSR